MPAMLRENVPDPIIYLRDRASTAAIARLYGKEGVDNGVVVELVSGNFAGTAETKDGTTSVSINFQGISSITKGMGSAVTQSMIDATVVHEGSHGFEQKMHARNGIDPMKTTLQGRFNEEMRAYRAEAIFSRGINEDSLWGYWTKGGGINEEEIKKSAMGSVRNACGAGGCGQ
ncbi:MAG: hypothetical protein J0L89_09775 [Xanthomonadales bacterium]|nr:hypothetical protein [Xanthomonadales bacterium]